MSRYFNGQEVELLAPAGNFEIFKIIINTGTDAVYFGGKDFNMRMHRKDFNFTNEEIKDAIHIAHQLGKKVYITVNNLLSHEELTRLEDYLRFLESVGPDALIVQDVSVIDTIQNLGLTLPIHASIMMNVHNLPMIQALGKKGVTRVVASRELSLATIKTLSVQTNMEFEYFVHGDMCVAHGAQCTYSGLVFGQSSNRGRCMKPCRWGFQVKKDGYLYETDYPLAVKDLSLYNHIPELIEAGIISFKIEGRMRDPLYLERIINSYSDAIDRYIADPHCYDRSRKLEILEANRNRDLSTAYAFGKPGLKNINSRYEGTGKFFSTGKVFSKPTEETESSSERITTIKEHLQTKTPVKGIPALAVKVQCYDQAIVALEEKVDILYLSSETYEPYKPFTKEEIKSLTAKKGSTKIYFVFPRMMMDHDFSLYHHYLKEDLELDGLLITELGAIESFKDLGLELVGDYSLNVYNAPMAQYYQKEGLARVTLSVESPLSNTKKVLEQSLVPIEMIVEGKPAVMYMEHDLYENTKVFTGKPLERDMGEAGVLYLVDEKGDHPVYRDQRGRNHMMLTKELSYLPFLKELLDLGTAVVRIEGITHSPGTLKEIITIYQTTLNILKENQIPALEKIPSTNGYTLGAMQFD